VDDAEISICDAPWQVEPALGLHDVGTPPLPDWLFTRMPAS
jgi:hypothetical protein